jgi:Mce-associated membrane protein
MTADEIDFGEDRENPGSGPDFGPEPTTTVDERSEPAFQRYLPLGAAALAAAGLIVAAVFGIQWWVASGDQNLAIAQAREDVAKAGTVAVKAFTEVDYTNPDAYFQRQLAIADSGMQDQIKNTETTYRQAMVDAKTKVTTKVDDIAVEELNDHDGKAGFLAAISYVVDKEGQQPAAKELRLEVRMTRVGQDWKVSAIGSVPEVTGGQ